MRICSIFLIFLCGCSVYRATEEEYRVLKAISQEIDGKLSALEKSHAALAKDEKAREDVREAWRDVFRLRSELKLSFHRLQKPFVALKVVDSILESMYDKK